MLSLTAVFLLGLLQLISCQDYDELYKDVCFRKIYVCGEHRERILGSSERFETDPHKLKEICRKHNKFISCVDDAVSNNCNGSMSDLALMTLNNRLSLKMFCTNLEWRKSYFSSVTCINENMNNVKKDCDYEESIYVDDRPWCLIPEQCDALQRVLNCTVQKMKRLCRETAAEVFRRIQILNSDNQDVVCELRRQNPSYCRYERQKRHIDADPQDRVAPSSILHKKYESEAMNNVVKAELVDAVKNLDEQRRQGFSEIIDFDELKLRKLLSISKESPNNVEDGTKIFKRVGFQENDPDLKMSTESPPESKFESNENIHTESDSDSYSFVKDVATRSRLRRIDDAIQRIKTRTQKKKSRPYSEWIPDHLVGTPHDPFYDSLNAIEYGDKFGIYSYMELKYFMEQMEEMRAHEKELSELSREKELESLNREKERLRQMEEFSNKRDLERLGRDKSLRDRGNEAAKEEKESVARDKEEHEIGRKLRHARSKKVKMAKHDEAEGNKNEQEMERSEKELHADEKERPIQNQT